MALITAEACNYIHIGLWKISCLHDPYLNITLIAFSNGVKTDYMVKIKRPNRVKRTPLFTSGVHHFTFNTFIDTLWQEHYMAT